MIRHGSFFNFLFRIACHICEQNIKEISPLRAALNLLGATLALTPCDVAAHGRSLDSQGGHSDDEQGSYHFHDGPLDGEAFSSWQEAKASLDALTGVWPQDPLPLYEIVQTAQLELHDGTLSDWRRLYDAPSLTEVDFVSITGVSSEPIGGPNLRVNVYLGWSGSRIYMGVERLDDVYINEYDEEQNVFWRHDGVELRVDGDRSGGVYGSHMYQDCWMAVAEAVARKSWNCIADRYYKHRVAQAYQALVTPPAGVALGIDRHKEWVLGLPYSDAGGSTESSSPHRSIIEIMVTAFDSLDFRGPEHSTVSELSVGVVIGLDIVLPDFDRVPGDYDGYHSLSTELGSWRDAGLFREFILLPHPGALRTAISQTTWGLVKRNTMVNRGVYRQGIVKREVTW